jgi:predicted HTH domain antitoxin
MRIWLELPDNAVEQLAEHGSDLSRAALEALAIDAYRMQRITGQRLRELLGISSRFELDGFLKRHGVPLEYSAEDFEREAATSARLWQKRQAERAAETPHEQSPE